MVQGVSSSAGKSLTTTALARALHRRRIDVVPFKAQNMSNNARVVDGGEISAAQYLQSLAAGLKPDVRMNPVPVKPEGDDQSQVVILGKPDRELSRLPWRARSASLWSVIENAMQSLAAEHELLLIEGAGSPAEINLRDTDLANMRTANAAAARVILLADIDRGGAFAHLYGTWALLPRDERARIAGFVLNRFRGDPSLLPPAPTQLEDLTGVPTLGVVPWIDHGLPDEDAVATPAHRGSRIRKAVAVPRYPTASNLDECKQLEQVADVRFAARPEDLDGADLVILPGSKHVAADLAWMVRTGLADALRQRAEHGGPVLGICGGMQILGEHIEDETDADGNGAGLALLPLRTRFVLSKRTEITSTRFLPLTEPWTALSAKNVTGYQIRHGRTRPTGPTTRALPDGLGFVNGAVLGIYLHGLFEQPDVLSALFGEEPHRSLDAAFDQLGVAIEEHLDVDALLDEVRTS